MTDPTSRVQIHENHPPMHPGTCILCISAGGDGRVFVDFGKRIARHGQVYFCSDCFNQVSSSLGWLSPSNFAKMSEEIVLAELELNTLKEENAKLRRLVESGISQLRSDLAVLEPKSQTVKRPPGRPKKSEPRATEQNSS